MPRTNESTAHDVVWVLDLDRFLLHPRTYELLTDVLSSCGFNERALYDAKAATEYDGGSFDALQWIETVYSGQLETIEQEFIKACAERGIEYVRMEGATALLEYLVSREVPFLVMTYGGERYQRMKIQVAGLADTPYLIVDTKRKGEIITRWRHSDGYFVVDRLGSLVAQRIILCDDKADAFIGYPRDQKGYWLRQTDLKSQQGTVEKNIRQVNDIQSIVDDQL